GFTKNKARQAANNLFNSQVCLAVVGRCLFFQRSFALGMAKTLMDVLSQSLISESWLPLLTLLLLSFLSVPFLMKRKQNETNLPPSPPSLPIVGNLHQLGKIPHFSLWKLSQKYGPLMLLQLGQIPTIVISSPETAKEVHTILNVAPGHTLVAQNAFRTIC
ncbi:hypothetical protein RJ639_011579, partial [Escallonia herrerae]